MRGLPEDWELDERESAILIMAARQADDVGRLETAVKRGGTMVRGSTGQLVVNPALIEARQGRLAVDRLLGKLSLPDEAEEPRSAAGRRAQRAANVRWDLAERRDGRRRGSA